MKLRTVSLFFLILAVSVALLADIASPVSVEAKGEIMAALLSDQKLGDKGPIDLFYEGFMRGNKELGLKTKFFEIQHMGEFEAQIRAMAEDEYDLIFVTFDTMADACVRVAKDFPNTHFVILDGIAMEKLPNVMSTLFREHEASFLGGVVAGRMTKTNKIGFIGGADIDIINRYLSGFMQGSKYVNPKSTIEVTYTNNFEDPAKAKELALMLNSKGCDVLLLAAAKSSLGAYDAAKQTKQLLIGAETPADEIDPKRGLTSVREAFDLLVYKVMEAEKEGRFKAGLHVFGIDEDMVDITPVNENLVPQEVIDEAATMRQKIKSGQIKVQGQEMLYSGMKR